MRFSTKVTALSLGTMLAAVAVMTWYVYGYTVETVKEQAAEKLEGHAYHAMDKIDRMMFERLADLGMIAADPVITSNAAPRDKTARLIEFRNRYKTYASISYFGLDRVRVADTAGLGVGRTHRLDRFWKRLEAGEDFILDFSESESIGKTLVYFGAFARDGSGRTMGVVVARMPVEKLNHAVGQLSQAFGEPVKVDLVDRDGMIIYSNYDIRRILRERVSYWPELERSLGKGAASGSFHHLAPEEEHDLYVREQGYLDFPGSGWTLIMHQPVSLIRAPAAALRNRVFLASSVIAALGGALSILISRSITRPLKDLSGAASEIGRGNLDVRVEARSDDEVGLLAGSFNSMAESLRGYRDEARAYSRQLEERVAERTQELYARNEQLKEELAERRRAEAALSESETKFRTIVDNISVGVYRMTDDPRCAFIQFNRAMARMFGYEDAGEFSPVCFYDLFRDAGDAARAIAVMASNGVIDNMEARLLKKDGSTIWGLISCRAEPAPEGGIRYIDGIIEDITGRKHMEKELKDLSLVDDLTGLYNRRGFLSLSEHELDVAERNGMELLLVFADLDHLKEINDTLGHQAGDAALRDTAALLRRTFRNVDIISRIGGDEFAVLVIDTASFGAEVFTDRLRGNVEEFNRSSGRTYRLSISMGVVRSIPGVRDTVDGLLEDADRLMYAEKGRKKGVGPNGP